MKLFKASSVKKVVITIGVAGLLCAVVILLNNETTLFATPGEYAASDSIPKTLQVKDPVIVYGMVADGLEVREDQVKKNMLFANLLEGHFVSPGIQQQLNVLSKKIFDFRRIAAGRKVTLLSAPDTLHSLKALVYESSPVDYVIFHFEDSLIVELCHRDVKTVEKSVTGEIQSSLSETIEALGISHELTNRFVDIFGWQVDFQRLQKGDKFKLIYEENQVEGQPIGIGEILAIYFEHFGNGYYAFPFEQGDGRDYFDEAGKSLRKALLKYPIEFTSISSRYNLNRFHPVAKVFRPHLGTDFAAPTGTPIRSVGDGVVEEAQYKANNGNYVKVRHNGTYTTAYLHMSKIAMGIVPGTRVRQGQNIGFVGSTGLATGPHVCYRFWRNGVQVDALRVELPPSQPVKSEYLESFRCVKEELIKRLEQIPFTEPSREVLMAVR